MWRQIDKSFQMSIIIPNIQGGWFSQRSENQIKWLEEIHFAPRTNSTFPNGDWRPQFISQGICRLIIINDKT